MRRLAADGGEVVPAWILIPAIGVEAKIEAVGIDGGQTEAPTAPWHIGR
jgi:hypothetical protein